MAEKFRKVVNAPHRAMGRGRKSLQTAQPKGIAANVGRAAAVGITGMFEFLLWAAKYVALDNHALRAMEDLLRDMRVGKNKEGNDKKLSAFMKKYPNFSAHIIYYLMFAMAMGAAGVYDKISDAENTDKVESVSDTPRAQAGTYGAFLERMRPIEPLLIADLIAKEGVRVNEQGLHIPYLCSRGHWTIGFGNTRLKNGKKVTSKTKPITTEEAYEQARWHLENETFVLMYWYETAFENVNINTTQEAFAIASIMYNAYANMIETPSNKKFKNVNYDTRSDLLRRDYEKYGLAMPDSLVRQRFTEYPVTHMESFGKAWLAGESADVVANKIGNFLAGGVGLRWRRWLEAGLITGRVTPEMLMNCPAGGMYEFFEYVGRDKKNWFTEGSSGRRLNTKTFEKFEKWLENPVNKKHQSLAGWKKVKDWLPADVREMCESGLCQLGNEEFMVKFESPIQQEVEKKTYVTEYKAHYDAAITAFRAGDFTDAAAQFEQLIDANPENALLHNDLAATYIELGRYEDAIASIKSVFEIGDGSQYGAAYYNAGVARENMGQLHKALANYKLAVANGNRRAQKDVTRLSNQLKKGEAQKSKKGKSKKGRVAFNDAAKKLRNNAHSADFDVSRLTRFGNDMA